MDDQTPNEEIDNKVPPYISIQDNRGLQKYLKKKKIKHTHHNGGQWGTTKIIKYGNLKVMTSLMESQTLISEISKHFI